MASLAKPVCKPRTASKRTSMVIDPSPWTRDMLAQEPVAPQRRLETKKHPGSSKKVNSSNTNSSKSSSYAQRSLCVLGLTLRIHILKVFSKCGAGVWVAVPSNHFVLGCLANVASWCDCECVYLVFPRVAFCGRLALLLRTTHLLGAQILAEPSTQSAQDY